MGRSSTNKTGDKSNQNFVTVKIEISQTINIPLHIFSLKVLLMYFEGCLTDIMNSFCRQVLTVVAEAVMRLPKKPFRCPQCNNDQHFKWKTKNGGNTMLLTVIHKLCLPRMQVQCQKCNRKIYITRKLLGVPSYQRIPDETTEKLGLIGALTSYRISSKIASFCGVHISRMTIWNSVQRLGKRIQFSLQNDELPIAEADGTGIAIKCSGQRGKEVKVLAQYKKNGGVHIAGLNIDRYNRGWGRLFKKSIEVIKSFKNGFLLITDGDTTILNALTGIQILVQRCLWHIPHQLKYTLWRDGVKRKGQQWMRIMGEVLNICMVHHLGVWNDTCGAIIEEKKKKLRRLIRYCKLLKIKHSATYLENALPDMFTAVENKMQGITTSRVERVMKTIKMRTSIGSWSSKGALNVLKIRLAYYYNGFDPL